MATRSYNLQMKSIKNQIETSPLMNSLTDLIGELPDEYPPAREFLFLNENVSRDLNFRMKPFKSVFNKIFRKNVIFNRYYPNANKKGGVDVPNFYQEIDDLLRTRIVCKYMDGPKWVCDQLKQKLNEIGITVDVRELSTDQGYYAWHLYFQAPVQMWEGQLVRDRKIWVEIQFTTQLSEVITSLTHDLYERRRDGRDFPEKDDWKK